MLVDLRDASLDGLVEKVFTGYVKWHCVRLIVNQDANVVFGQHFLNLLIGILRVGLIIEK